MSASSIDFLRRIVEDIPVLNSALNRSLDSWGSSTPPITVIFADVGDAIAKNLSLLSSDVQRKVFASIEEGVVSEETVLRTAMATGLLEALVVSADKEPDLWKEYHKLLGSASLKHALEWRSFDR